MRLPECHQISQKGDAVVEGDQSAPKERAANDKHSKLVLLAGRAKAVNANKLPSLNEQELKEFLTPDYCQRTANLARVNGRKSRV